MALYDASEMRILEGYASSGPPSRYGSRRFSWPVLAGIAGAHLVLAATLNIASIMPTRRVPSELKVINLSAEAVPPPPVVRAELPKQVLEQPVLAQQSKPVAPTLDAPTPIVAAPLPAPIAAAPQPTPPMPTPAPAGPVRVADLDAKAVTIVSPKYPIESRRKREQGIVVLAVTLTIDGRVDAVAVARSSGFDRLDKAALEAVRRWRWSATMRDGTPVVVKGTVDIPFVLQG